MGRLPILRRLPGAAAPVICAVFPVACPAPSGCEMPSGPARQIAAAVVQGPELRLIPEGLFQVVRDDLLILAQPLPRDRG